jgi:hypothetical protein
LAATRLPVPGDDEGVWGTLLNDFLAQAHNPDGSLKAQAAIDDAVSKTAENLVTLADSQKRFLRIDIPNDGSDTALWPDRYANYFNGTRTGYFNEYGEVRARPAKASTVALRAMGHTSGGTTNIFEVANTGGATKYFTVASNGAALTVPLASTAAITAPNIGAKVLALAAADPVPPGTPAGTVILRTP